MTTTSLPETTTSPTANAVLVLSTQNGANKPMIVDFDGKNTLKVNYVIFILGNVNEDLKFEYGEGATALYGCGATLFGEFWYFGSGNMVRKLGYFELFFESF